MAKNTLFTLQPEPTFKAPVTIQKPGGGEATITVEFKHRGRKALAAFFDELTTSNRSDVDALLDLVVGWEGVDAKFDRDALELLLDAYPTSALALFETYRRELLEARAKN